MKSTVIKLLGIGALGVGLLGFGGIAMARGPMGGHAMKEVLKSLDLDEEQKSLAMELREEQKEDHEANRAFHEESRDTFMDEMGKEKPNSRTLHNLIDEGSKRAADTAHRSLDALLELHATFTPEQRESFVVELERAEQEHQMRREEKREGRHGSRPPGGELDER